MKKWQVSDIRWASISDLKLPIWIKWNKQNPLPDGFWQRIWEYPYVVSKVPKSDNSLDIGGTYPFILFKNFPHAISVDCRNLNKLDHPYHLGKWPKKKLIICDAAKIPVESNSFDCVFSISSVEEMPHIFKVLKEMIRIARHRIVVTMDISDDLGFPTNKLRELEELLNIKIPKIPNDALTSVSDTLNKFKQSSKSEYKNIRVLAFTIDSVDKPKSIAILIPHWNSWSFLKLCLEHIQINHNKELIEKIYVLDDASNDGSLEKAKKHFKNYKNIEFHRFDRHNKYEADVGLLLDYGLKLVKEQYVVTIDADLFPLSPHWLTLPIWVIEKYGCSSVGLDTGLSNAYSHRPRSTEWWHPDNGYLPHGGIYDNSWFTCTNNLYRVMPTALAKVVSEQIGFTRASPHLIKYRLILSNPIFNKINKILGYFYQRYQRHPYLPGGEDNGVAANHFIDINKMGPKFNIPLTSYIGLTPKDGAFGQNVSGLVFHFALSTRALSESRREVQDAGSVYYHWVKMILATKTINDNILKKMIRASRHFQPGKYDGSIPISWYKNEYSYIQKLLKEYQKSSH